MTPAWDLNLFFALNNLSGQSRIVDGAIVFCATYLPYLVVALFVWYLWCRSSLTRREQIIALAAALFAGLLARFAVGSTIRYFYPRPRPFITYHVHQLISENSSSFPSGHSLFFFAFSTVVFSYSRKLGMLSYALTILICLARVAAGIHYPTDILAGAILGIACGYLTTLLITFKK